MVSVDGVKVVLKKKKKVSSSDLLSQYFLCDRMVLSAPSCLGTSGQLIHSHPFGGVRVARAPGLRGLFFNLACCLDRRL